jgi:hypothetical protein
MKEINLFQKVQQTFTNSEFGPPMAAINRYDRYRSNSVSVDRWREWFGADVDGLKHLKLTYYLAKGFLIECKKPFSWPGEVPEEASFSSQEQEVLLLAALVHDWGEAIAGDVSYALKETTDKQIEVKAQKGIARKLFAEEDLVFWDKLNQALSITQESDSKLGQAFNMIERLGYLRTGVLAWQRGSQTESLGPKEANKLFWLTADVLINQISALINKAQVYPPVLKYFQQMKPLISAAFEEMPDSVFQNYEEGERESKKAQFKGTANLWADFVRTNFDQNE